MPDTSIPLNSTENNYRPGQNASYKVFGRNRRAANSQNQLRPVNSKTAENTRTNNPTNSSPQKPTKTQPTSKYLPARKQVKALHLKASTLQEIFDRTSNLDLKNLITFTSKFNRSEVFSLIPNSATWKGDAAKLTDSEIGLVTAGKYIYNNPLPDLNLNPILNKGLLLQLNVGSFGLDINHLQTNSKYFEMGRKLITYLDLNLDKISAFTFQDFPEEEELFAVLKSRGFELIFWPNLFYSEGKNFARPNCGLLIGIQKRFKNQALKLHKILVSPHAGLWPRVSNYQKNIQDLDLLSAGSTLTVVYKNLKSKEIYQLSNLYISAFSSKKVRLEIASQVLKNQHKIETELCQQNPECQLISRITGDFNLYGTNTLRGPLGLKSNPFSFLPTAVFALISGFRPFKILSGKSPFTLGGNPLHKQELQAFLKLANKHGYQTSANHSETEHSFFIYLSDFVPKFLKPVFKNAKVGWLLDIALAPKFAKPIRGWLELEPFGNKKYKDHKALWVSLE